jgi:hypothetical protein
LAHRPCCMMLYDLLHIMFYLQATCVCVCVCVCVFCRGPRRQLRC